MGSRTNTITKPPGTRTTIRPIGPHLGNFEIGSPDLEKETMRGLDVSLRQGVGRVQGEANFY